MFQNFLSDISGNIQNYNVKVISWSCLDLQTFYFLRIDAFLNCGPLIFFQCICLF